MTCKKCNLYLFLLLAVLVLLTNGCMHISSRDAATDHQTQLILQSIKSANSGLETFKGLGSVKLLTEDENSSFRLAWAGQHPDRLRLIILVSGKRIETFAANEESFFLKSYTGAHGFIKQDDSNASLEKLVSIPIKTNEIISLLSGKIPLTEYSNARMTPLPDKSGYVLELSKFFWGIGERLYLDSEKKVTGYEMIKFGKAVYSVSLDDYKEVNSFRVPFKISITSEKASCHIKFSNYYTNPEVDPSMFILRPD